MRRTTGVSSSGSSVGYSYNNGALKDINVGDALKYSFLYDCFGRKSSVSVGNGSDSRTLASYQYTGQNMTSQTYGNGAIASFVYDPLDRLSQKSYNDSVGTQKYSYDLNGNLYEIMDSFSGTKTTYNYDLSERVTGVYTTDCVGGSSCNATAPSIDCPNGM